MLLGGRLSISICPAFPQLREDRCVLLLLAAQPVARDEGGQHGRENQNGEKLETDDLVGIGHRREDDAGAAAGV